MYNFLMTVTVKVMAYTEIAYSCWIDFMVCFNSMATPTISFACIAAL